MFVYICLCMHMCIYVYMYSVEIFWNKLFREKQKQFVTENIFDYNKILATHIF